MQSTVRLWAGVDGDVCFYSVNQGDAQRSVAIPHFAVSYAVVGCIGRAILDHFGLREGAEEAEKRNDVQTAGGAPGAA